VATEDGVLAANVWRRVLGVERATVIEAVEVDEEIDAIVARVRARRQLKRRWGVAGRWPRATTRGRGGGGGGRWMWAR
jgi:hypothetical protein